jgi:hypothetical protein
MAPRFCSDLPRITCSKKTSRLFLKPAVVSSAEEMVRYTREVFCMIAVYQRSSAFVFKLGLLLLVFCCAERLSANPSIQHPSKDSQLG